MIKMINLKENLTNYDINLFLIGENCFYLGIFFLSSALPVALIFLLTSIVIVILKYKKEFFFDKSNLILLAFSSFLIFSNFASMLTFPKQNTDSIFYGNSWISLLNWIPLLLVFRAFQFYLKNRCQRDKFIKFLIAGSFPIIFSMFAQYFFNIYGPFSTLNGLIIWFQKPLSFSGDIVNKGVAGLFSNQNYTAYWLSILFPLLIYNFKADSKLIIKKFFLFILIICFVYLIILTDSRSAFLSMAISFAFMAGLKIFFKLIIFAIFIFSLYVSLKFLISPEITFFLDSFFNRNLFYKLSNFSFIDFKNFRRIDLYLKTIFLIVEKPLFGWIAGSFAIMFALKGGSFDSQHAHNLFLQLAFDYGIIASILLSSFVFIIFFKSSKKLFYKEGSNLCDKAWFTATTISIFFHLFDIPYYEGRISILFWALLAGLKSISDDKAIKQNILSSD